MVRGRVTAAECHPIRITYGCIGRVNLRSDYSMGCGVPPASPHFSWDCILLGNANLLIGVLPRANQEIGASRFTPTQVGLALTIGKRVPATRSDSSGL